MRDSRQKAKTGNNSFAGVKIVIEEWLKSYL